QSEHEQFPSRGREHASHAVHDRQRSGRGSPSFYGLQQHMYSTYNASTASGIEELAALQRGAAAAGLHTL
ncbi:Uncharacterized protein FKW44_014497, partial [Caligus rogercresseyi]